MMASATTQQMLTNKQAALLATTLGLSVLYFVDPKRFKKYIRRPVELLVSGFCTALGVGCNIVHDIAVGKTHHDEWKLMIKELHEYLKNAGLYEEWVAPDHLTRCVIVLNAVQRSWSFCDRSDVKLLAKATEQKLPTLSRAEHFMKFASAVYGMGQIAAAGLTVGDAKAGAHWKTIETAVAKHCNVAPDDILVADVKVGDSIEYLRHMIVVDHAERSIVLAVRGTISISSVLVDLAAYSDDFCGGHAHAGMAKMTKAVWARASKAIAEKCKDVPEDYDLVITGHSLGAGVACLITIMLHHERESGGMMQKLPKNIRCMAYAPPPVFYPLSAAKTAVANTTAYVHNMDCVPSLSVHGARRLVKTINDLDVTLKMLPRLETVPGRKPPAVCVEAVQKSIVQPLSERDRAPPLCVPAHSLVWMHKEKGQQRYSTTVLDPILYSRRVVDVHSKMLSHHSPPKYEHAFRLLVQSKEATM